MPTTQNGKRACRLERYQQKSFQSQWARETEHPNQTLVLTKTAGRQAGWGHCYLRPSITNWPYRRGSSEFTQQDGRKKRTAKCLCDKRDKAISYVFCRDLHLTSMFSGLLQKDLFKGKWILAKSYFKQNYCHACHTRFAVFFPLPSCCVSSLVSHYNTKTC